jgi:hypothetical protein
VVTEVWEKKLKAGMILKKLFAKLNKIYSVIKQRIGV